MSDDKYPWEGYFRNQYGKVIDSKAMDLVVKSIKSIVDREKDKGKTLNIDVHEEIKNDEKIG